MEGRARVCVRVCVGGWGWGWGVNVVWTGLEHADAVADAVGHHRRAQADKRAATEFFEMRVDLRQGFLELVVGEEPREVPGSGCSPRAKGSVVKYL